MRNPGGRSRVGQLKVRVTLDVAADQLGRLTRCSERFEDYCAGTGGVRTGIPLSLVVADPEAAGAVPAGG